MNYQQKIKDIIVELAANDQLPMDMNELDPSIFDGVFGEDEEVTPDIGVSYWVGSTKVTVHNIDEAKQLVTEIQEVVDCTGEELSSTITDFFFEIESDYQAYHGLDEDNWDIVN